MFLFCVVDARDSPIRLQRKNTWRPYNMAGIAEVQISPRYTAADREWTMSTSWKLFALFLVFGTRYVTAIESYVRKRMRGRQFTNRFAASPARLLWTGRRKQRDVDVFTRRDATWLTQASVSYCEPGLRHTYFMINAKKLKILNRVFFHFVF